MYRQCYTERASARQRELSFGLLMLMEEIPYEKISVIDLCRHMQISRKTFYRHFSSKNEALEMLIDLVVLDIGIYTPPVELAPSSSYQREMSRFFWYWFEKRNILRILLENSMIEEFFFRLGNIAYAEMGPIQRKLRNLEPCQRETIFGYYIGGLVAMLLYWMKNNFTDSPEEMASRVLQLVYNGESLN